MEKKNFEDQVDNQVAGGLLAGFGLKALGAKTAFSAVTSVGVTGTKVGALIGGALAAPGVAAAAPFIVGATAGYLAIKGIIWIFED